MPGSGQSTSHAFRSFFEGDVSAELFGLEPDQLVHVVGFGDTSVNVTHVGIDGDVGFVRVRREVSSEPWRKPIQTPNKVLTSRASARNVAPFFVGAGRPASATQQMSFAIGCSQTYERQGLGNLAAFFCFGGAPSA